MKRRSLIALAFAVLLSALLVSSCSFLLSDGVTITNMSAASVTITCDDFTDGTTCTIPAYGSVTKQVTPGVKSILVQEEGLYYQKGFETLSLPSSGSVQLTPDTAWIRIINNTGQTITSASMHGQASKYNAKGEVIGTSIPAGSESWIMVTSAFSSTLDYVLGGVMCHSIQYASPKFGQKMTLRIDSSSSVAHLAS